MLRIRCHRWGPVTVLSPTGELDASTAGDLRTAIEAAQSRTRFVLIDLAAVSFLDCAAIGTLIAAAGRADQDGRRLQVAASPDHVHRLFALFDLYHVLGGHRGLAAEYRQCLRLLAFDQPTPDQARLNQDVKPARTVGSNDDPSQLLDGSPAQHHHTAGTARSTRLARSPRRPNAGRPPTSTTAHNDQLDVPGDDVLPPGLPLIENTGTVVDAEFSPQQLAVLAHDLHQQKDALATMQHVVQWAAQVIPGAQHASVSVVHRRRAITSAAATGEMAGRFDDLQQQVRQGPGLDSMYEHQTVRVHDLSRDGRWPLLARRSSEVGVRSVLSLQLFVHGQDLGALTVVSSQVDAFADTAEHWGLLVASHAAVALAGALKVEGLSRANANRTVIGQAQGVLMERLKVNAEDAFAMLARISQNTNRKLHDVAEDMVATGNIPATASRR